MSQLHQAACAHAPVKWSTSIRVTLFYGSSTLVLRDCVECLCVAHTLAVMWNGCPDQPQGAS